MYIIFRLNINKNFNKKSCRIYNIYLHRYTFIYIFTEYILFNDFG